MWRLTKSDPAFPQAVKLGPRSYRRRRDILKYIDTLVARTKTAQKKAAARATPKHTRKVTAKVKAAQAEAA